MKISCSCGAFFYSHLQKDITDFMKAHSVCEESVEPPTVTRAREILEECGIVDVQGTPADQLRPLVELIEDHAKLKDIVAESAREIAIYIDKCHQLQQLCGLMKEPDVVMEWVSNNKAPGWPIFRGFPVFQSGEIFHCYRVPK